MDFGYLFTSFQGRINRKSLWMAAIVMVVVAIVVSIGAAIILGVEGRGFSIFGLLLSLALAYPWLALAIKRLHDRSRPDYFAYLMVAPSVLTNLAQAAGLTGDPANPNALSYLLTLLAFLAFVWAVIELGCLRGTVGPNEHGPDPLEGRAQTA